mmetsp:Transcript_105760/g.329654  ORF Transcript_105760/g.329654 Transcript_105760/m.329654 type:complete len:203 (+) Transcript_105760:88-696(+)
MVSLQPYSPWRLPAGLAPARPPLGRARLPAESGRVWLLLGGGGGRRSGDAHGDRGRARGAAGIPAARRLRAQPAALWRHRWLRRRHGRARLPVRCRARPAPRERLRLGRHRLWVGRTVHGPKHQDPGPREAGRERARPGTQNAGDEGASGGLGRRNSLDLLQEGSAQQLRHQRNREPCGSDAWVRHRSQTRQVFPDPQLLGP